MSSGIVIAAPKRRLRTSVRPPRLFEMSARSNGAWARYTEGGYSWWGRSDKSEVIRMCGRVLRWVDRFPAAERKHLVRRLMKTIDAQHVPAVFELYVHENLRRSGYTMRCEVAKNGLRLDFLASRHGQPAFYVEAKSPMQSEAERRAENYRGEVLDLLNKYRAPGFLTALRLHGRPTKQVPFREFRLEHELRAWLRSLNQMASWQQRTQSPGHVERFSWPDYRKVDPKAGIELHLTITAQPCEPPKAYDLGCFAAATTLGDAFIPRPDIPISNAIAEKATRYGDLDLPYVIAVNVPDNFAGSDEVCRGIETGFQKAGPRARTNVSGILLAYVPNIAAAVDLVPVLYVNPTARHPLAEHVKYFHPFQGSCRVRRPGP